MQDVVIAAAIRFRLRQDDLEAYRRYVEDNLERIERGGWTPVCFDEFRSSEERETYGEEPKGLEAMVEHGFVSDEPDEEDRKAERHKVLEAMTIFGEPTEEVKALHAKFTGLVRELFPECEITEDDSGQFVIYTAMCDYLDVEAWLHGMTVETVNAVFNKVAAMGEVKIS